MLSTKPSSVLHPSDAQQQYEQLVASINGIVWEANPVTLQFIFVSQQAERLLGYPVAQWLTPDFWADHLHPDDRAWVLASCRELIAAQQKRSVEYRMIAADGRTVWFQDTISMALAGNQVSKLRGVMVDITERKRAEEDRLAHVWFLESMDQINRAMQGTQTLDEMMRDVLDTVLAIFNCDRAWLLYPCDPETSSWRVPMERTRPGYPGALAWGLEVPSDLDIIHVFQIVRAASGPVKFGPGSEYPLPTEAKTRYQVQSELAMAIYPKVDKPYMFGLHQCAYARIWTEQEGRLFQEIGRRLGDALSTLLVYSNLQESEQRYREVFENTSDAIVISEVAEDGRFKLLDFNLAWERLMGLSRARMADAFLDDFGTDETVRQFLGRYGVCLEAKRSIDFEQELITPTGRCYLHTALHPVSNATGKIYRLVGIGRNITEQKKAEAALSTSEARFRTFVDHATDAFFLHGPQGVILNVNQHACESLGYTREELIGNSPTKFDLDWGPLIEQITVRLTAGEIVTFETRHRRKDGRIFPVEVRIRRFWEDKHPFAVSLVRDITERKQAEGLQHAVYRIAEAATNVKSLDAFFSAVHQIVQSVMAAENFYIALYDEAQDLLSFPYFVDEMDVSSPQQKPSKGLTEYVLRTGKPLLCDALQHEELIRRGEAALVGVSSPIWLGVPLKLETKTIGVMVVQHYSNAHAYGEREKAMLEYVSSQVAKAIERKQTEQALRQNHNLLNAVVEGTSDAVFVKDLQGRYLMINSAGARLLGKQVEEVIGKDDRAFFTPETASTIMADDRRVLASTGLQVFENIATAAGVTRTYLATKGVYRDGQGKVIGLFGISRDVTDLKQMEEQLRQAQKMEAVGRLAGGVAHDFNNLLTVINGYSGLILGRLNVDDPNRKRIAEVHKAGERAANLTRQLLAFSRKQVLQPQLVNLNTLLEELLKLLQPLLGEDIELALAPDASLGLAKVDPGQFEQAIINLAVNARDAMPEGGRLTIETHNTKLDEAYAEHYPEVRPGDYSLVVVSDSGQGMEQTTLTRIFEPFFTTKEPGKGTGLGLAMVYGFVKQSGGHIEVASELGQGTIFKVYLPQAEELIPPAKPLQSLHQVPNGSETILLVEDEGAVRTFSKSILETSGYTVLEASDGQEAITVAQQYQGPIHILVTDLVMPRMSGRQLADRLAETRPYIRLLFMSGYTDDALLRHGGPGESVVFLQKPFSPSDLARKVRQVLDATGKPNV